jgi:UDP-glucose 4-epimerase
MVPSMKTLVTGGAGFIGSHIVDRLVARGDAVTALDDLSTGSLSNLTQHADAAAVRIVEGTILDEQLVDHLIESHDRVFHLAAAVGVAHILAHPLGSLLTNSRGSENVLAACARHGRKVVVASSSEVYGKTDRVPMREDDDRVLGSTTVPRWSYSTAKALDEHLALAYAAGGLRTAIVRYFNIYGPRMDPRGYASVMANLLRQATSGEALTVYGDGTQTCCFTYVDDCVDGTLLAMHTAGAEGQVINIGNRAMETSVAELARLIVETSGSDSRIEFESYESHFGPAFEDTRRRVPSTERATQLLGWTASIGLVDGLRRTLDWWSTRRA